MGFQGDMAELVDATDLNHNKTLSLFWKIKKVKALKFRETPVGKAATGASPWIETLSQFNLL